MSRRQAASRCGLLVLWSLATASNGASPREMIEASLPGFERALGAAREGLTRSTI